MQVVYTGVVLPGLGCCTSMTVAVGAVLWNAVTTFELERHHSIPNLRSKGPRQLNILLYTNLVNLCPFNHMTQYSVKALNTCREETQFNPRQSAP